MSFEAGWYAVAIAEGLEPGTSAGTRLFDKEIVVWRDQDGASHAWEDRCPHRGMRLSFGFVRGNHIACLYHGWQYDTAGQCRYIPAHPNLEVPDTIKVVTYPSAEAGGLVWIWSEMTTEAPVPPPADFAARPVRSLYVERSAESIAAAFVSGALGDFEASGPSVFETVIDGARLRLALQPFTAERSALHIVRLGGEADPTAIAAWSEGLRRGLEAPLPVRCAAPAAHAGA
ncbi:nitrite reductase/ring-hydroxylating ferredoxin subunit [Kaistia hirudinis]|uniref:Nitrite reductase/ring-hydroxylating ferredoxin subunit n=1 Tax=Kaistia hirudinis TaxID=1293440 RepID=A0A840AL84_9HYPH|nr:Rieske (2Fe-2S) protein [Kaistia hirudinis]MBB3930118.1 nitrite reductase/ring-hydroxylating ferredoxin subunit [Kaistia hirudinis]